MSTRAPRPKVDLDATIDRLHRVGLPHAAQALPERLTKSTKDELSSRTCSSTGCSTTSSPRATNAGCARHCKVCAARFPGRWRREPCRLH